MCNKINQIIDDSYDKCHEEVWDLRRVSNGGSGAWINWGGRKGFLGKCSFHGDWRVISWRWGEAMGLCVGSQPERTTCKSACAGQEQVSWRNWQKTSEAMSLKRWGWCKMRCKMKCDQVWVWRCFNYAGYCGKSEIKWVRMNAGYPLLRGCCWNLGER